MSTPTQTSVADDAEIVRRILAHIDAGTTDQGDDWREPVENYVNPIRFTAELETLRSFPSVYLPSAAIPNVGDHAERVTFGVPLFAVRDRDGRARVFRYHGWTYRVDGSLTHVPHAEAFPDLDMSTRGLVQVDSREVDGLIVIGPLQSSTTDSSRQQADTAMATLADGSPWRDKRLP